MSMEIRYPASLNGVTIAGVYCCNKRHNHCCISMGGVGGTVKSAIFFFSFYSHYGTEHLGFPSVPRRSGENMEKPWKKIIMVTSSLNEISTDQLENRVVVRGKALLRPPPSLHRRLLGRNLKTTSTVFLLPYIFAHGERI